MRVNIVNDITDQTIGSVDVTVEAYLRDPDVAVEVALAYDERLMEQIKKTFWRAEPDGSERSPQARLRGGKKRRRRRKAAA